MFKHWAMPVTSRPWAIATVALERIWRLSFKRLPLGRAKHVAWERAVGVR